MVKREGEDVRLQQMLLTFMFDERYLQKWLDIVGDKVSLLVPQLVPERGH